MDKKHSPAEEIGGYCHIRGCNNWAEPNARCGKCGGRVCHVHATEIRGEYYCADCMKEYPEACDRCGGPTIDGLEIREIGLPDRETGYRDRELLCRVCAELPDAVCRSRAT